MAQDLCNQSRVRACTKSTQIYISGLVQRVLLLVRQFVVVDVLVIEPGGACRDVGNHGNLHGTIKGGGDGMWGFEDGMWRCANRLPRLAQGGGWWTTLPSWTAREPKPPTGNNNIAGTVKAIEQIDLIETQLFFVHAI
jgi:hypothetical protein